MEPMTDSNTVIDLLLVDDEADFRDSAEHYFKRRGYRVTAVESGQQALKVLEEKQFDVAVVDVHMPEMDGVKLLEFLRENDPDLQVIMLTGGATVPSAVASLKAGAVDYVTKPVKLADLDRLIAKSAASGRVQRENTQLRHVLQRNRPGHFMVGESEALKKALHLVERLAPTNKPVLIEGESGTGKELVARAIHAGSDLRDKPLVVINCAALPESLLESELFGHEKGAFTGAVAAKPGLFEMADGGTLFVDEFGELAGGLQAKLLRVLEDGVIRRIGSVKERRVQVRLIAATNRHLATEVAEGRFREDLFYRVNVLGIQLPPLRDRGQDVLLLARHFLGAGWNLSKEVADALAAYSWPGNIRQLSNAIERAKVLTDESGTIFVDDLPQEIFTCETDDNPIIGSNIDLDTLNRSHVEMVLQQNGGNKAKTARALGVNRRSLYRLLEKFGIA
ncbi:MAG: sigma-54-dependent Fis family transcriptional regulator [Planctomycetaceae bacterium]|nr:sigma-54-dependent Fis family transcriptional regulator [Planctomycetaceae bacterium]